MVGVIDVLLALISKTVAQSGRVPARQAGGRGIEALSSEPQANYVEVV